MMSANTQLSQSHTPSRPPLHRLGRHSPAPPLSLSLCEATRARLRHAQAALLCRDGGDAERAGGHGAFPSADMRRAPSVLAAAHYSPVNIVLLLSVTSQGYREKKTRAQIVHGPIGILFCALASPSGIRRKKFLKFCVVWCGRENSSAVHAEATDASRLVCVVV